MYCGCCFFIHQNNKYFIQCEKCKKNSISQLGQNENTNICKGHYQNQYKWYEFHKKIIRTNPEIRLIVELFCLFGFGIWCIIAYLEHFNIVIFSQHKYIRWFITTFLSIYVIVLFCYLDSLNDKKNYC